MNKVVTEMELAELEHLLAQSHAEHAEPNPPLTECADAKCTEARWDIEWLRRSRKCLSGSPSDAKMTQRPITPRC